MNSDRRLWEGALELIRQHGGYAPYIAQENAGTMLDRGNGLQAMVWLMIRNNVIDWGRPKPRKGEYVH